jgi:cellulose synthase operon protein C
MRLASKGIPLKVAIGDEPERDAAEQAIWENARKGCVLDLLAFRTASQLRALDTIAATCGRIHLTQSVMDRLRSRREEIDQSAKEGLRWMRYDAGKLAVQEVAAEVAGEDLPPELREHLRAGWSDIFDSVVLAIQTGVLLVTDDLPTREISRLVSGKGGAWLHPVFSVALNQRRIDFDTYVRWSAQLVDGGHNYIGITGPVLVRALHIDAEAGGAPRHLFKTLSKMIWRS